MWCCNVRFPHTSCFCWFKHKNNDLNWLMWSSERVYFHCNPQSLLTEQKNLLKTGYISDYSSIKQSLDAYKQQRRYPIRRQHIQKQDTYLYVLDDTLELWRPLCPGVHQVHGSVKVLHIFSVHLHKRSQFLEDVSNTRVGVPIAAQQTNNKNDLTVGASLFHLFSILYCGSI